MNNSKMPPPRNPSRNNNLPPQHNLPSNKPQFPFSSPISAEVSSPTSSQDEKSRSNPGPRSSPTQPSNPFLDNESDDTSGQDDFGLERYTLGGQYKPWKGSGESRRQRSTSSRNHKRSHSMNDITREGSKRQKEENKKKRPGLNVVTNFSKGAGRAWTDGTTNQPLPRERMYNTQTEQGVRSHSEDRTIDSRSRQPNGAPAFVSLDDLKGLASKPKQGKGQRTGPTEKATDGHGRFLSPDQRKLVGEMGSSKGNELSPSDRPIMIGITIPSQDLADHASPQSKSQSAKSDGTPATPAIVITPAKEDGPWSTPEYDDGEYRRPASSIYSQATPYVGALVELQDVPPVPSIPQKHVKDKPSGRMDGRGSNDPNLEEFGLSRRKEQGMSTDTLFEEDDSPQVITRARSDSTDSQQGILRRSSLDTATTRHQSRGWWNLMLSPLLTRSNTLASRKSPTLDSDTPQVPSLAKAAEIVGGHNAKRDKPDSPVPQNSAPEHHRGESIWNDLGEWERKRQHADSAKEGTLESQHKAQDSSGTIPFMIASPVKEGSAAEYFQACAHDLDNPIPYFKCQNHSCALESVPHRALAASAAATDESGNSRSLADQVSDKSMAEETNTNPNNPFFKNPSNRLTTAFHKANSNRTRPDSVSTVIEDEPELSPQMSPNVREANAAPVLRAKPLVRPTPPVQASDKSSSTAAETSKETPSVPPPYSPPHKITKFPKYVAIMPPDRQPPVQEAVQSPGPVSPSGQQAMASKGAIQMSEMQNPQPPAQSYTINHHYYPGGLPPRPNPAPVTRAAIEPPQAAREDIETRRQRLEKEDAAAKKVGGLWRGRGCISNRGCFGRGGPEGRKRRRWYMVIASGLVLLIVLAIVLATTLTRKGDGTPVQSQWLNLTGFPPMPTGVSTIAQPDVQVANSGCVHPSTLWSCAVSKEQQKSIAPNDPDQPNFRFEIRFRNGTLPNRNGTSPNVVANKRSALNPVTSREFVRHKLLKARDAFTDALYTPSPAPPSLEDQNFLGNTTDNNTAPFIGEETPFYITFLPTTPLTPNRLVKRQNNTEANATVPDITDAIPPPSTNPDGTAAAANLLPFPSSQPIRLYNRGQDTEHYGFYTYYDRSIFLKSIALLNSSAPGEVPDDENGGALESAARVRCTWAQTRFLVQIWTRPENAGMTLLQNSNGTVSQSSPTSSKSGSPAANSAIDFARPGSFPYPLTITVDRHGGDIAKKMVYCYGMDDRDQIISSEKKFQMEFRDFGGQLVNPALGPFTNVNVSLADGGPGGIDGGAGGCGCQWVNWAGTG
jgi:hypothetical protein